MTALFRSINVYWYLLPLVISVSLVYSASRHESWGRIARHAARLLGVILGVIVLTAAALLLINTQV